MLEVTHEEMSRLHLFMSINNKHAIAIQKWTEEMELEVLRDLLAGKATKRIMIEQKISSKKVIDIRKKYGLWGA